jgi:outer membrane protein OmpA-like peptidoglycan-associated protein
MRKISLSVSKASGLVLLAFLFLPKLEAQQLRSLSGANSPNDDTNPVWIGSNTLLFTRAFHSSNLGGVSDPGDIWMTRKGNAGEWEEATHRPDLSTKGYDVALGLEDALTLLVLRTENGKSTLHQYSKFGQDWNYLRMVNFPDLQTFEGLVSGRVAAGGKLIFLAGKRAGGYGNEDIYLSRKIGPTDWSSLMNLGPAVNGKGQEMGPFFDPANSQLYFSSNSHPGASGKDILISKQIGEPWDSWSKPEKWEQISSRGSETSIAFISPDEVVWTSTQNSDGFADLMTFSTPVPLIIPTQFVAPVVPEPKMNQPTPVAIPASPAPPKTLEVPASDSAKVNLEVPPIPTVEAKKDSVQKAEPAKLEETKVQEVKTSEKKEEISKVEVAPEPKPATKETQVVASTASMPNPVSQTVSSQEMELQLFWSVLDSKTREEIPYSLSFQKGTQELVFKELLLSSKLIAAGVTSITFFSNGYFPKQVTLESVSKNEKAVVLLTRAELGTTLLLENVNFKRGTAEFEDETTVASLNELAAFMIANPAIKIRINGHTDNAGDPGLNKKLSLERAGSVRDFLIDKGVNFENLRISGWGGTRPVASNATEEGRAKNRRVELVVEK